MEWTRSPLMRTIALAASSALVLVHWEDRGRWFWVGAALVALNLIGLLRTMGSADGAGSREGGVDHAHTGGRSHRLDEWLALPGVAAAFAAGPRLWRQVSYLDDEPLEPTTAEEIAQFVWIEDDHGWAISLGDEVKPYLDLDVGESDDPLLHVLKAHPGVDDAYHEDREVYRIEHRHPITTEEFAELAARALVAHHVEAAAGETR